MLLNICLRPLQIEPPLCLRSLRSLLPVSITIRIRITTERRERVQSCVGRWQLIAWHQVSGSHGTGHTLVTGHTG